MQILKFSQNAREAILSIHGRPRRRIEASLQDVRSWGIKHNDGNQIKVVALPSVGGWTFVLIAYKPMRGYELYPVRAWKLKQADAEGNPIPLVEITPPAPLRKG